MIDRMIAGVAAVGVQTGLITQRDCIFFGRTARQASNAAL